METMCIPLKTFAIEGNTSTLQPLDSLLTSLCHVIGWRAIKFQVNNVTLSADFYHTNNPPLCSVERCTDSTLPCDDSPMYMYFVLVKKEGANMTFVALSNRDVRCVATNGLNLSVVVYDSSEQMSRESNISEIRNYI